MKINRRKHLVTKGKHKGLIKDNPKITKRNVGNWINTQTTVKIPIYKDIKTGRKKIIIRTKDQSYQVTYGGKKGLEAGRHDNIFDWDESSPRLSVIDETKEVISGYRTITRPLWIHRITGSKIKITPGIIRKVWNISIKDRNELFWTNIGNHPLFKSAYDLAVDYMKRHP